MAKPIRRTRRGISWRIEFSVAWAAALFSAAAAQAAPPVQAKVVFAGVYANGNVYVQLDTVIAEPGCSVPRFDLPASSPVAKTVLATALMAAATGKTVRVATYGCFNGAATLDPTQDSYFFVFS